jgi:hypothetical protein
MRVAEIRRLTRPDKVDLLRDAAVRAIGESIHNHNADLADTLMQKIPSITSHGGAREALGYYFEQWGHLAFMKNTTKTVQYHALKKLNWTTVYQAEVAAHFPAAVMGQKSKSDGDSKGMPLFDKSTKGQSTRASKFAKPLASRSNP